MPPNEDHLVEAGYFDWVNRVHVRTSAHRDAARFALTAAHELAHRNLTWTTTLGLTVAVLTMLEAGAEGEDFDDEISDALDHFLDNSFETQEGWATYQEQLYARLYAHGVAAVPALPTEYQRAIDQYLSAGRSLPESALWLEPLLLTGLAIAALNVRVLDEPASPAWLRNSIAALSRDELRPDARLTLLVDSIAAKGWPPELLRSATRAARNLADFGQDPSQMDLVRAIEHASTTDSDRAMKWHGLAEDSAAALVRGVAELECTTELHPTEQIIAWWDGARAWLASLGIEAPPALTPHLDWLTILAGHTVEPTIEPAMLEHRAGQSLVEQIWRTAPDTVHVHMHLENEYGCLLLRDVADDAAGFLRERLVSDDVTTLLGVITAEVPDRRSLSVSMDTALSQPRLVDLLSTEAPEMLDLVLVQASLNPRLTLASLRKIIQTSSSIILARTEMPPFWWALGYGGDSRPRSGFYGVCCRGFPGFIPAFEQHEPALAAQLWKKANPLPARRTTKPEQLLAYVSEMYALGGNLPPGG